MSRAIAHPFVFFIICLISRAKWADSSKSLDEKKDSRFLLSNHKLFRACRFKHGECWQAKSINTSRRTFTIAEVHKCSHRTKFQATLVQNKCNFKKVRFKGLWIVTFSGCVISNQSNVWFSPPGYGINNVILNKQVNILKSSNFNLMSYMISDT